MENDTFVFARPARREMPLKTQDDSVKMAAPNSNAVASYPAAQANLCALFIRAPRSQMEISQLKRANPRDGSDSAIRRGDRAEMPARDACLGLFLSPFCIALHNLPSALPTAASQLF